MYLKSDEIYTVSFKILMLRACSLFTKCAYSEELLSKNDLTINKNI